ncbi:MAG: VanW family protein [bacterium]
MSFRIKNKFKIAKKLSIRNTIFGLTSFLLLFSILVLGYNSAFAEKTLLNSYLLDKNVSSLDRGKLLEEIERLDSGYEDKKIRIVYEDKSWEVTFEEIAWQLDKEKTVERIIGFGHSGRSSNKLKEVLHSIFLKKKFDLSYSFNEKVLIDWIGLINQEIGSPKNETNIIIKNGEAKITDSSVGRKINDEEIEGEILDRLRLYKKGEITARLIDDLPQISREEAEALIDKAKSLTDHEVVVVGASGEINLTSEDLGTLIKLKKEIKRKLLKKELGEAYVSFNEEKISNVLKKNFDVLNTSAVDARFTISGGSVALISPSQTGEEINLEESIELIVKKLEDGKDKIILPTKVQQPSIVAQTSEDISKIGVRELIGSATTNFRSSPPNRVHNIENGVKFISGSVIKPGDEFSTVGRLGTIDQSTGYLPELVIREDETVPEFGGGLCQVSTTLFRAALDSGLRISERQNHSYRVSYYEPPVGMDATIYYPRPDFKFVNDTDNYILVYGYTSGTMITFDFYGTRDGRQSEISDPVVYDITSPPDPIYTDDPTLEPGEEKQIDRAHNGAKAKFDYIVRKDGKIINQQTFASYYTAWPAKFLRGPQSEEAPQESPAPSE